MIELIGTGGSSGGTVTSISGLSGVITQSVANTGTTLQYVVTGQDISLKIPDASASVAGFVSTGTQTIAGAKTLTGLTTISPATGVGLTVIGGNDTRQAVYRQFAGQTANVIDFQDSTSTVLASVLAGGFMRANNGSPSNPSFRCGTAGGGIFSSATDTLGITGLSTPVEIVRFFSTSGVPKVKIGDTPATVSGILHVKSLAGATTLPTIIAEAITSQTADLFQVRNSSSVVLSGFNSTGYLMAGQTSATAWVDIVAGSTAVAQLRLRAGVAPTTPNDGDVWATATGVFIRLLGVTKQFTIV